MLRPFFFVFLATGSGAENLGRLGVCAGARSRQRRWQRRQPQQRPPLMLWFCIPIKESATSWRLGGCVTVTGGGRASGKTHEAVSRAHFICTCALQLLTLKPKRALGASVSACRVADRAQKGGGEVKLAKLAILCIMYEVNSYLDTRHT